MSIKSQTVKGFTAKLLHDPHGGEESPREYEPSTFFGFHRSYASPDTAPDSDPEIARAIALNPDNIALPVWLYAHGGTCYKAAESNPFHCPWDSGLFGYIFISRKDARDMYGVKRITAKVRQRLLADLTAQVDVFSQWANGEMYCWEVTGQDGETVESVGGYYDADLAWSEALEYQKQEVATYNQILEDCTA